MAIILASGCIEQSDSRNADKESSIDIGFRVKFEQFDKSYNATRVHELFVRGDKIRLDYDEVNVLRKFYFDKTEVTACMRNIKVEKWLCAKMPPEEGDSSKERLALIASKDSNFTSTKTFLGIKTKCLEYKTPHSVALKYIKCYHPEKYFLVYDEGIYESGYKEIWTPVEIDTNIPKEDVFILPSPAVEIFPITS